MTIKMKKMTKTIIKRVLLVIGIIILWYIGSLHSNPIFIPSPSKVLYDLQYTLSDGSLWIATVYSLRRIAIATIFSMVISIPTGLLIYNVPLAKDILAPIAGALRYLPVTAFYPLLIMWFGINEEMKVMFLFIATFVYMMPSVLLALEEINPDLINTGITIGMTKMQLITKIQMPATLPSIMNSFIVMIGTSFSYIAVCETVNAKYGLGWIIQQSSSRGRTDMVFMAIIVITILSVICDSLGKYLIRKAFKWKYYKEEE
jgi:NitT/TauT family transport system permease protein